LALLEKQMVEEEAESDPIYGVKILEVVEGHQGEELGLNKDDIILEYDGVRTNYPSSLVKEVKKKTDKKQVGVTVLRYGMPMQFVLRGGFIGVRITTVKVPKKDYDAYLAGKQEYQP
jgi:S1-C subfamily serine protease